MPTDPALSDALRADLLSQSVDVDRALAVLGLLAEREAAGRPLPAAERLPDAADPRLTPADAGLTLPDAALAAFLAAEGIPGRVRDYGRPSPEGRYLAPADLRRIGVHLLPRVAYGVLNGGSATSYIDVSKNRAVDPEAFAVLGDDFAVLAEAARGKPKGVTAAWIGADGSAGPSFLLLKLRARLLRALEYRIASGDSASAPPPFFELTSPVTAAPLTAAYAAYAVSPLLAPLAAAVGAQRHAAEPLGAVQPLLAAFTHSADGPRRVFGAYAGQADRGLPLPGGHGEAFRVLAPILRGLRGSGVRWAYLGNVDNSGYTVDPGAVAELALRGADAAFEFTPRTPLDTKGGVLTLTGDGRLGVSDLGQGISWSALAAEEAAGKRALFNCAVGLFDLDYLVPRLDEIAARLPIRISDQAKDFGRYAQAEQNLWDVVALVPRPLIRVVEKARRFVAAKTLMETCLASPIAERIAGDPAVPEALRATSRLLRAGWERLLAEEYGFAPDGEGDFRPLSVAELELRFKAGNRA
jgi:hypothetical protein